MHKLILSCIAVLATLSLVSTASAKGGGGGGTVACAQILGFSVTANSPTSYTTSYSINANCFDEGLATAALDYRNTANSFTGRAFWVLAPGISSATSTSPNATPGASYTVTLTIYGPNGKAIESRTATATTPLA